MFTPLAANPLLPTNNPLLPKETQASSSQKNTLFLIETAPALIFSPRVSLLPSNRNPKQALPFLTVICLRLPKASQ